MPIKTNKFFFHFKVISYFIFRGDTLSGGHRIFIELIKRWADKGCNIEIFTTDEGKKMVNRYICSSTVNVHAFPLPIKLGKLAFKYPIISALLSGVLTSIGAGILLQSRVKDRHKTIIYSVTPFLPDIIPAFLFKLRMNSAKWLVGHSMFAPHPLKGGFRGGIKKFKLPEFRDIAIYLNERITYPIFKKYADLFYETNELDRKRAIKEGACPEKVFVIRGGVDTKQPQLIPEPEEKKYDAVFIGRLHPQKGVLELIDIWKYVMKTKRNAMLAIIGNGPLEDKVRQKIKKYNMHNNIKMFGFLDGLEKIKVFKDSKIVLHPALYDSGGMAACEAMICGLPGVSFDLPALKVYYPKGMLKTPCYDLKAFAENILRLLENKSLYNQLRKDAINWAKEWDWNKVAEKTLMVINGESSEWSKKE